MEMTELVDAVELQMKHWFTCWVNVPFSQAIHVRSEGDEYSDDLQVLEKVVLRVQEFVDKVDEEDDEENED